MLCRHFATDLIHAFLKNTDELLGKEAEFVENMFVASLPLRSTGSEVSPANLLIAPVGNEDPENDKGCSFQSNLLQILDDDKMQKLRHHLVDADA